MEERKGLGLAGAGCELSRTNLLASQWQSGQSIESEVGFSKYMLTLVLVGTLSYESVYELVVPK
jgi:hypothetical protein